ncbi:carbohydrate ABC transporter permease [Klenkia taihuensis]|uniref:Xylobiose transport system permease protein n=1 Tax=Klenkia taihuensis TaxID=1225127 RepID=A0A1I1U421_9ACTN|nr:sugar ABC transporter permease [Klenkia taihuensis]GHE06948.1 ABC transporter [Klenkia taihuensis]SFD65454.1 xylobiose transport system permease protein [Klenkia taihuensis]
MTSLTAARAGRRSAERRADPSQGRPGVLWALPGLLFFGIFAIVPMVGVLYLSFTDWDGLNVPSLIGLDNWTEFFSDSTVLSSTVVTFVLLIGNLVAQTIAAVLLGAWSAGPQRNRAILSSIFFIPLVLSIAAAAVMWRQLLDPNFGVPSKLEWLFGDGNLLGTQTGAIACLIAVGSWQYIPFHALLYQGAARAIPRSLYEAAEIDGAGRYRQFRAITLPQLRNTMVTSMTFMIVGGLTAFEIVLVLTNGGPGSDTTILPFLMYREAFQSYNMGYASTIAVLLLVLSTAVSLVLVRLTGYDRMKSTLEGV